MCPVETTPAVRNGGDEGHPRTRRWSLLVAAPWRTRFPNVGAAITLVRSPHRVLQERRNARVMLVEHGGTRLVVKRSKTQERSWWARVSSLWRRGESTRTFRRMLALHAAGLPVPEPVLALEESRLGIVVASWLVYQHLDAGPCTAADKAAIVETLHGLHERGWVHRDPNLGNFLLHRARVFMIDCRKARPWPLRLAQASDVFRLNKSVPGALDAYAGFGANEPVYRVAVFYNAALDRWRGFKAVVLRRRAS